MKTVLAASTIAILIVFGSGIFTNQRCGAQMQSETFPKACASNSRSTGKIPPILNR